MTIPFQRQLLNILSEIKKTDEPPHLLLHCCCAPCSSYVLEYLSPYFKITVFYYNPNISPQKEYEIRVNEIKRFVKEFPTPNPVEFIEGEYEPKRFYSAVQGLEDAPEGGERCIKCFELRLSEAAKKAQEIKADYFVSTLTISPMKNASVLNQISEECSAIYKVKNLPSDFKKKNGYKRSIELSNEYNLYRQDFCGCVYSKRKSEAWKSLTKALCC